MPDCAALLGAFPHLLAEVVDQTDKAAAAGRPLPAAPNSACCVLPSVVCSQESTSARILALELDSAGLVGTIPHGILRLNSLERLVMSNNALTGSIPPWLSALPWLRTLSLEGNRLSGSIPAELGRLSRLQVLLLGKNELSGTIPEALAELSSLETLELGSNRLSGPIPAELSRLRNLTTLFAAENDLEGRIPPLRRIRFLSLHGNARLSGTLGQTNPTGFCNLKGTDVCTSDVDLAAKCKIRICERVAEHEAPLTVLALCVFGALLMATIAGFMLSMARRAGARHSMPRYAPVPKRDGGKHQD
ncbi:hypothetical protein HK105_209253 [Polyrhizophydium stewartii]|uniref:Uncharacterized protein n=1 Tax=Polyrhizophydium stewartii TaxID=2732419 RepID=A0ABR4MVM5_9FUNG